MLFNKNNRLWKSNLVILPLLSGLIKVITNLIYNLFFTAERLWIRRAVTATADESESGSNNSIYMRARKIRVNWSLLFTTTNDIILSTAKARVVTLGSIPESLFAWGHFQSRTRATISTFSTMREYSDNVATEWV